jgi:formylglycine-generating enzyme required for sulfatase activity
LSEAARIWSEIKDLKDIAVFEAFKKQYGPANAFYDMLATRRIAELTLVPAACDGLLVSVATGARPCIKPGSGESFRDCPNCPEMVIAPAGGFRMGSLESEADRLPSEGPQHLVTIAKPFAVGKFAVTFAEWDACVDSGGCSYIPDDKGWGRGDRPVINVSWDDAKVYIAWLSKKTGKSYRLLTEAEREYVARAETATPYWWGASITPDQANYYGGAGKTVPVRSFKPNPWWFYQVHGNVWEWVEDCWVDNYKDAPSDGSARTTGDCAHRVLRGGSWLNNPQDLRAAYRVWGTTVNRYYGYGFRLARTLLTP